MKFQHRRTEEPEINLIPFIDVLLVILIFLMLSSTYSRFTELQLTLPVAQADPPPVRPNEVAIGIAADGRVSLNGQTVEGRSVEALTVALRAAAGGRADALLVVSADALASHQSVINVLDAARRAGLGRLAFAAQRGGSGTVGPAQ